MLKLTVTRSNSYQITSNFTRSLKQINCRVYLHKSISNQISKTTTTKDTNLNINQYAILKDHINNLKYQNIQPTNNNNELAIESNQTKGLETTEDNDTTYLKSLINGLMSHTHSHDQNHTHSHSIENIPSHHGHSHGHAHTHSMNNPLLVMNKEEIRKNAAVRITWVGLGINVGIAIGKFVGGIVFHSQALFADSIHALSDMVCDFLTLFSVRLAANKPTPAYPNGYGKIETLGSLAVSTILMTAGISIGWSSLCGIVGPIIPHTALEMLNSLGHGHSHAIVEDVTDINAAWIAAASILAKEWIFRATKDVAIKTQSNVLMANAWHHRADSLTSLVALVTITSGYLCNIQSLDMIGGLLVSAMVVKAGYEGLGVSIKELLDKSISKDDPRYITIEETIADVIHDLPRLPGNVAPCELNDLIVLSGGPNVIAHAKILVNVPKEETTDNHNLNVKELNSLTQHLRKLLEHRVTNFKKLEIEYITKSDSPTNLKSYSLPTNQDTNDIENHENHDHIQTHSHGHNHTHDHAHGHKHFH